MKILAATLLMVAMLCASAAPALAQEYVYNPASGDYAYCGYYSSGYWCYANGYWFHALPGFQYGPLGG